MKIERIIFGVIIALSMGVYAYAESCSGEGNLRFSASGCSYTTEICCHGVWTSGSTCSECASGTCWNGSKCEESIKDKCGSYATQVYGGCESGKGWFYNCKCDNGNETYKIYNNDPAPSCPSCTGQTKFVYLGSVSIASTCANSSSLKNGSFFGQSGTVYEACKKAADAWWETLPKYIDTSEISIGSCAWNGTTTGGMGGYHITTNPNVTQNTGSDYTIDCSNTNTYGTFVYCVPFGYYKCCNSN